MQAITTKSAPAAIGPYSQAVKAGGFVFTSGQIPLDPRSGEMVRADIGTETERVLENLEAVLKEAGCTFADVVRSTIYLVELADFATVNEHYGKRFSGVLPARSTVQVAGLPKGARVEIDMIAFVG